MPKSRQTKILIKIISVVNSGLLYIHTDDYNKQAQNTKPKAQDLEYWKLAVDNRLKSETGKE